MAEVALADACHVISRALMAWRNWRWASGLARSHAFRSIFTWLTMPSSCAACAYDSFERVLPDKISRMLHCDLLNCFAIARVAMPSLCSRKISSIVVCGSALVEAVFNHPTRVRPVFKYRPWRYERDFSNTLAGSADRPIQSKLSIV